MYITFYTDLFNHAESLIEQARLLWNKQVFMDAEQLCIQALNLYQDIPQHIVHSIPVQRESPPNDYKIVHYEITETLGRLAILNRMLGNFALAHEYVLQAIHLAQLHGFDSLLCNIYSNAAGISIRMADYPRGLNYLQQSIELSRSLNNLKIQANALANTGNLFWHLNEYDLALPYYQQALHLYEQTGLTENQINMKVNIATVYMKKKQDDLALLEFAHILDIPSAGDQHKALVYLNRGSIFKDKEQWKESMNDYSQAVELYSKLGMKGSLAIARNNLAGLYLNEKAPFYHPETALEYILLALDEQRENKEYHQLSITLGNLVDIMDMQNRWKEAYQYLREKSVCDGFLHDEQIRHKVAVLTIELLEKEKIFLSDRNAELEQLNAELSNYIDLASQHLQAPLLAILDSIHNLLKNKTDTKEELISIVHNSNEMFITIRKILLDNKKENALI
jgi:tetratricopeptide (TPR) repeat protein